MKRYLNITLLLLLLTAPATVLLQGQAQAPAPASTTRAGRAFISGENPSLRLLDRADGTALTQVSFWRAHWSPVGRGHVCYVTVGEPGAPGTVRVALYDNQKLFDYLTNEILGTFNKAYTEQPFTPIPGATFGTGGDAITEHREQCRSEKYNIELIWRDLQTPALVDVLAGSRPSNPFGLTYLRVPAGSAEVIVNGERAPGLVYPAQGGTSSSAFLAFGETWLK